MKEWCVDRGPRASLLLDAPRHRATSLDNGSPRQSNASLPIRDALLLGSQASGLRQDRHRADSLIPAGQLWTKLRTKNSLTGGQ
jgi:hypothetical protein